MSIPNIITLGRILLVPIIVWAIASSQMEIAFAIFIIAGVSDAVDGFLAKRFNMASELGALLDPLADKALLVSALILLSIRFKDGTPFDQLPLWFPVLVVSRDLMLLSGTVLIHMLAGRVTARPRIVGKCATFFQMIVLGWVLLKVERPSYEWPLYAAGFFTLVSGIWYIFDGMKQLGAHEQKK